jgi:2-C-methyl-D-erythritol 4-phosphate cytidylyltransferase
MEKYVLIAAAGKGTRMRTETPKQFVEVNNKPLLMHTIEAFSKSIHADQMIIVVPDGYVEYWKELCEQHHFYISHNIIEGGPQRFHSVMRGLTMIPNGVVVAIHDAVRPFVSKELIREGFKIAARKGNAVPVLNMNESIREVLGPLSKAVNRDRFKKVQTPQFFHSTLIKKAYQQPFDERFTDDSTVLESGGKQIFLFDGDTMNFKVTTVEDLKLAELIIKQDL